MPKTIDALLEDIRLLGEEQFRIVEEVRALAKRTIKPLKEEVKYGGILFSSGHAFGGVFAYKDHVSVEFSQGARIKDSEAVLEGSGKVRRHIKLKAVSEIKTKKLAVYLALAHEAAAGGA